MKDIIIAAGIVIQTTAPPLAPADAVKVFTASSQSRFVPAPPASDAPTWISIGSRSGDGPFGSFAASRPMPLYNPPITFRIPRKRGR